MLKELKHVSQKESEARRRWFADRYFDLIVWYEPDPASERILGFQLCYDKLADEHALTWRESSGFAHHRIDDGQPDAVTNMTPILVPDGAIPVDDLRATFFRACGEIDPKVSELVLAKLDQLSGGAPPDE